MKIKHPVDEGKAALFHGAFAVLYAVAIAYHGVCAWRHYRGR